MKKKYIISSIIYFVSIILFVTLFMKFNNDKYPIITTIYFIVLVLSSGIYLGYIFYNNRCPYCGKFIRYIIRTKHCPYCGKEIEK